MSESPASTDAKVGRVVRRVSWIAAVVAIVIGVLGLIFPEQGLAAVGLFIGIYLVVAGITRIATVLTASEVSAGRRVFVGVVGALVLVAGILTLNNPFRTLAAIVLIVGVGWILDGIGYIIAAFVLARAGRLWALALAGALLVVAGIVIILLPIGAIAGVYFLISLSLLIIGAVSLAALIVSGVRARKS